MELELIAWLRDRLPDHPALRLGPGDDAAVLRWARDADCVMTVDLLTDGVDFELEKIDARRVGRKALAVSLSDLAAMAARPVAAVVALALPRRDGRRIAEALYEGMLPLAEQFDAAIAGGDTNSWDGPLVVSVTAIGETTERGALRRDAARPGMRIVVTGAFGGSILGHHFDFQPRVHEALLLHSDYDVKAAIDVSDGLSIDLAHLAGESGCGALVETERIPVSDAAVRLSQSQQDGRTALDHALSDGEDFELILAAEPDAAARLIAEQPLGVPLTDIGQFIPEQGLWRANASGKRTAIAPRGYEHVFD